MRLIVKVCYILETCSSNGQFHRVAESDCSLPEFPSCYRAKYWRLFLVSRLVLLWAMVNVY